MKPGAPYRGDVDELFPEKLICRYCGQEEVICRLFGSRARQVVTMRVTCLACGSFKQASGSVKAVLKDLESERLMVALREKIRGTGHTGRADCPVCRPGKGAN